MGIVAQIILNLLEPFDLASIEPNGAERFHLEIEAARLAYAVWDAYISDLATMTLPVDALIDKALTEGVSKSIRMDQRMVDVPLQDPRLQSDTTYLIRVDKSGLAISLINSLYMGFGSGMVTEKSGIILQNRGAGFRVEPGHPNTIEGGKRPLHTIIPAMALENGKLAISFGVMGGLYQPLGQAHVITNMVDFGMDPQEALESPWVFWDSDGKVTVEETVGSKVISELKQKGHQVAPVDLPLGGGQVIQVDPDHGTLIAGSDPRKDGCALGC